MGAMRPDGVPDAGIVTQPRFRGSLRAGGAGLVRSAGVRPCCARAAPCPACRCPWTKMEAVRCGWRSEALARR